MNDSFSFESIDFVEGLLHPDPKQRLGSAEGVKELKRHSWCSNVNWDKIIIQDYEPPIKPKVASSYDTRYFDPKVTIQHPVDPPQPS